MEDVEVHGAPTPLGEDSSSDTWSVSTLTGCEGKSTAYSVSPHILPSADAAIPVSAVENLAVVSEGGRTGALW